jgi:pimeloyl-ACP methyl ester carboxylesterase
MTAVRRTALAALLVAALAVAALLVWDGGIDADPRRELLPGVRLDLREVQTPLGVVEYDLAGMHGPVVLSVHAGLGGADQGRLFADFLRADFRILSPSRPGYLATPLESGRTAQEQADLLAALLDELGIDRVGVLGVSAGSTVAYTFAARHPDRVWALVSIGGVSRPRPPREPGSPVRTAFLNSVGQKLVRLTATLSPRTLVAGTLEETSTFTDEQKAERTAFIMNDPALFTAMLDTTFPYPDRSPGTRNDAVQAATAPPLDRIVAPTLVVHGTHDGDVAFEDGVHAVERVPGAERYWMNGDDHLGFWLGPAAGRAQATVRGFLQRLTPP